MIRVVVKEAEQPTMADMNQNYELLIQRGIQLHCDLCERDYPVSECIEVFVKESGSVIFTCPTCRVPRVHFRALKK